MAKSIRFKVGMQVKINAENTGVAPLYRTIAQMGFSNGDTVKLVDYDPEDETWFVQSIDKIEVRGWIKRKNLAPIEPQPQLNPFKVGDKVELVYEDAEWASSDNVTTGVEYTVKQVHNPTSGQEVPYIKVEGGDARGVYWIECKYFKQVKEPKPVETPKRRLAVCVDMSDSHATNYIVGKVYEIREEDDDYYYLAEIDGTRLQGGMFKWRFKEIVDQSTPVGPRVGDTLTERWLKDGTPRFYWGFQTGGGWLQQTVTYFKGDRKIEEIGTKDGRMAAKISGTMDIWIDLAELIGEKSTVDKTITVTVSKDKLAAFNKEVQALVAKYK